MSNTLPQDHNAAGASRAKTAGNADAAEIARFDALAASWWDADGPFRPLHRIGPARLSFIRDWLTETLDLSNKGIRPLAGVRLLDIGCGGGLVCEPMARLGATVTGIDLGADGVAAARVHAAAAGLDIDYRVASVSELAQSGERFDAVLCLEVLEHVPDPVALVAEAARLLEPGGAMVLSTINRTAKSYGLAILAAEYLMRWLPRGTHSWERFITLEETKGLLENAGLNVLGAEGLIYEPLQGRFTRGRDTDVNYIVAARKPAPAG